MSTNTEAVIYTRGIKKSFKQHTVLDGVDLSVQRGSVFALLGPNGAGKTTLVNILTTLLKPDDGYATVALFDVVQEAAAVRRAISLTGQYAAVDELLTGEENLLMMGRLYHLSHAQTRRRTSELLHHFDLEDAARRPVKTYSGGMRRRLDLAISLIAAPPIIFLDEPTTGLDPRSRIAMWAIVRKLVASGITIFLTTQYLEEADQLADMVAVMDGGKIIAEGTAAQLKQQVGKERMKVVFATISDLERAQGMLGDQSTHHNTQERRITIALTESARQIRQILGELEQAGILVESVEIQKPTLDDVFLTLTGRQAAKQSEGKTHNVQPHL
jgi:ABC-2 type transport system ATP-binding protein